MIEIEVNGRKIKTPKGELILDALKANGIHVPTLCNLEGFRPTGACRLCVVEIEGRDELIPSCSYQVEESMKIRTHSSRVVHARKTILELLLSNHEGGCLHCDRGRWCKLQDLAAELNVEERKYFGNYSTRKIDNTSQSVIRDPSKCILCSRCVRVCDELQVVAALDFLKRGSNTEVGTVLDKGLNYTSCISCGQCIQVCPTGALKEKSHLDQVTEVLFNSDNYVVALVDPAIHVTLGEFFGCKPGNEFSSILVTALKRAGFNRVVGSGWGLEFQAGQLEKIIWERQATDSSSVTFLSECPAFISYVTQSRPDLIPNVAPFKASRHLMSLLLRRQIAIQTGKPVSDIKVVYLTSCVAAKNESAAALRLKDPGALPDFVLTTREVFRLIRLFGIQLGSLSPEYQEDAFGQGVRSGHLGAISGGYLEMILRIMQSRHPEINIAGEKPGKLRGGREVKETSIGLEGGKLTMASVSSIAQFEQYFKEVQSGKRKIDFIEVMACQHGCINGGGQPCRGADRNLRNRIKGILDWDDKYSGIHTSDSLNLPLSVKLSDEEVFTTLSPRSIIK